MQWYSHRLHQIHVGRAPHNSVDLPPAVLRETPFFGWLEFTQYDHAAAPFDSTFATGDFFMEYPANSKAEVRSWS